jgi:hypothetical protein
MPRKASQRHAQDQNVDFAQQIVKTLRRPKGLDM